MLSPERLSGGVFAERRCSEFVELPSGRYHLRHWSHEDAPLLLMLYWLAELILDLDALADRFSPEQARASPRRIAGLHTDFGRSPCWNIGADVHQLLAKRFSITT